MSTDPGAVSPRCQQQLLELSAYLEGDLGPDQMAALDAHLAGCECCGRMAASLRRAIALCRSEEVRDLPSEVQADALARVRALLRGDG
jgi:anti-sigma factor RsiW